MNKLNRVLSALVPILLPLTALVASLITAMPAVAATTANITITATPSFISISSNDTDWNFGVVATSSTTNTTTTQFDIDNTSTVIIDVTISVNQTTWTGGAVAWNHAEDAVPGADLAGLNAQKGGTWGAAAIAVPNAGALLANDQAATTDFAFGLSLKAPTSFSNGDQKTIKVVCTAAAA